MFLTSAVDNGRQRLVICVDRRDGKIAWEQVAWTGEPEPTHEMNGWASASCCTDGERVYASFGGGGMHCYTVDGKHVWSRDLGKFLSSNKRGTAASPRRSTTARRASRSFRSRAASRGSAGRTAPRSLRPTALRLMGALRAAPPARRRLPGPARPRHQLA